MAKASPFKMTLKGSYIALLLATIVSGGKIDAKQMRIELLPLGKGVKTLREAFSPPQKPVKAARKKSLSAPRPR